MKQKYFFTGLEPESIQLSVRGIKGGLQRVKDKNALTAAELIQVLGYLTELKYLTDENDRESLHDITEEEKEIQAQLKELTPVSVSDLPFSDRTIHDISTEVLEELRLSYYDFMPLPSYDNEAEDEEREDRDYDDEDKAV